MEVENNEIKIEDSQLKAGYLVLRLKTGWGIIIGNQVEIRVSSIRSQNEVQLAIRAPKQLEIRKLK